jgi:hypothetical protein
LQFLVHCFLSPIFSAFIFVCSVVFTTAAVLEYLQTLTPDRHGTLFDASEKIVGGALGIFAVRAALRFWNKNPRSA